MTPVPRDLEWFKIRLDWIMNGDKALDQILTQTAEVQVTIVATVTVPADRHGNWLQSDAVAAAVFALGQGRADYEAHQVTATGAPGPFTVADDSDQVTKDLAGMTADEATSWTPPYRFANGADGFDG